MKFGEQWDICRKIKGFVVGVARNYVRMPDLELRMETKAAEDELNWLVGFFERKA